MQQRGDIEFLPHAALSVAVLRAQPRRRLADALRRKLLERAQAERALDEQRGAATETLVQDDRLR